MVPSKQAFPLLKWNHCPLIVQFQKVESSLSRNKKSSTSTESVLSDSLKLAQPSRSRNKEHFRGIFLRYHFSWRGQMSDLTGKTSETNNFLTKTKPLLQRTMANMHNMEATNLKNNKHQQERQTRYWAILRTQTN